MKQEINPVALIGIVAVFVALIAMVGYRMLQPAPYTPSPGVVGTGGATPGAVQKSAPSSAPQASSSPSASSYYPSAPPGSIPGKPVNSGN